MLGEVALLVCGLSLLVAGASQMLGTTDLRSALREHRMLPKRIVPALAAALSIVEVCLGGGLLAFALWPGVDPTTGSALAAAASGLLLAYACYLSAVLCFRGPGVPCGCGFAREPITTATVARAGLLSALAGVAALDSAPVAGEHPFLEALIISVAALALGSIIWSLPGALADPYERSDVRA